MDAQMQKSRTVYARGLNNFCGGQRGRYLWGALPTNGRDCMSLPWSVVETERGTGTTVGVQTNASACVVELSCNPPKSSATNSWAHTHTHTFTRAYIRTDHLNCTEITSGLVRRSHTRLAGLCFAFPSVVGGRTRTPTGHKYLRFSVLLLLLLLRCAHVRLL